MVCFGQKLRERPKCREFIEQLLRENYTLQEIYNSNKFSNGLRAQAKKMSQE